MTLIAVTIRLALGLNKKIFKKLKFYIMEEWLKQILNGEEARIGRKRFATFLNIYKDELFGMTFDLDFRNDDYIGIKKSG